jgi:hypothetical protein
VGFLFSESKEELINYIPRQKPSYSDSKYNAYRILEGIRSTEKEAPFHFASSVIKQIEETPFQEMATHTFSHYFCLEERQNIQEFEADLKAAIAIATEKQIILKSIVFPRNQFNNDYILICQKLGITNIRGNPIHHIYQPRKREDESIFIRLLRLLDTYIVTIQHKLFYVINSI